MQNNQINKKYHYILVKQHNTTKLKYLCYHYGTKLSKYTYLGSGKYWKLHLKKHGKAVSTLVVAELNTQSEAAKVGKIFSVLWDIVKSKEFANLTIEDARTTFAHLGTSAQKKSLINRAERRRTIGYTNKELENHKRISKYGSINTPKKQAAYLKRAKRLRQGNFTAAELAKFKKLSTQQQGVSMAQRLKNPNYVSPMKGKTMSERIGRPYQHPKSKKCIIIVNDCKELTVNTFTECLSKLKLSYSMLNLMRLGQKCVVRRVKSTKHTFNTGDVLQLKFI